MTHHSYSVPIEEICSICITAPPHKRNSYLALNVIKMRIFVIIKKSPHKPYSNINVIKMKIKVSIPPDEEALQCIGFESLVRCQKHQKTTQIDQYPYNLCHG